MVNLAYNSFSIYIPIFSLILHIKSSCMQLSSPFDGILKLFENKKVFLKLCRIYYYIIKIKYIKFFGNISTFVCSYQPAYRVYSSLFPRL